MGIGDRIRRARLSAGLTQRRFAELLGVTHGLVANWETHRKSPGRENLRKIAEVTFTDAGELLSDIPRDSSGAVLVTDAKQRQLLRVFARLSPRAQDNILELIRVTRDVAGEIEQVAHPPKPK